ncbi:malto-oligosyltrehalose synthase [Reyranella sp.]|uniref:malto-oligosyltrehalose synthase n=1 Tax=Reyranella sp. TaxID=1929291 RepID=UPI003D09E699
MTPRATLRLQFHKGFTFADAEALVPYFAALGVSHLYASPITTARAGSLHGYDVTDPTQVSPELGGETALKRLVDALRREKLGLIVDIVPNHMAATLENAWWVDVLRNGQDSRYARWFDIDWEPGTVFLPWLGKPAADVTAKEVDALNLPKPGAYRLGWWRTASDRINWRRFFDINELVCLRMEDDEAFEAAHAMIARLYAEGTIDGVRVDHIDGLADPAGYCRKLRQRLDPTNPARPYLVVEKILLRGETLPAEWGCDGTTGYDFMDEVSALQHDPAGEPVLAEAWATLSGRPADFATEEEAARREIIARSFSAPLEACIAAFHPGKDSDLSRPALRRALTELLVHFPVYRGYGTAGDAQFLRQAAEAAKKTGLPGDRWVIDWLHGRMRAPGGAVTRFQQLSSPVAAKSVEDTAFYRYGKLLSRNDVGFDVERFGDTAADFHARMQRRQATQPHGLLATATHDHKRGEDSRARLAVLSEKPEEWTRRQARWIEQCALLRTGGMPDPGDIAMLLQMIVGAWPLDLALEDTVGRATFAQRLAGWQQKALREAKLKSDWADPDTAYETAAQDLLHRLVVDEAAPALRAEIFAFIQEITPAGAINGLSQTLLRLTAPGVPDLYQGTELWDFSLVDPDNRRPVDFVLRQKMLGAETTLASWRDGAIKQKLIVQALALRRALPDLFAEGSYEPVKVEGRLTDHIVAFMRRHKSDAVLTVVPRLPGTLIRNSADLSLDLQDTRLSLSDDMKLFNALDDRSTPITSRNVALQQVFTRWPLALFSTRKP